MFMQQAMAGLSSGSSYALLALGLALIFITSGILNFAQGEMAMVSSFVAYTFMVGLQFPFWLSVLATLIFAAIFGILVERIVIRPLLGAPVLSIVIATLGLNIFFNNIAKNIWGSGSYSFPTPISNESITVFGVSVSPINIVVIGVTLVMMLLLFLFLKFSRLGIALRATAQEHNIAILMGVRPATIYRLTWMMGSMLGALAGVLLAPIIFLDTNMMVSILIKAFAGAVLGGLGSLPGVVIGGMGLGVMENLVAAYIHSGMKEALALVVIIAVLLIRPNGLFGKRSQRKV